MSRLVRIGEAARAFGVSISTLRRWELDGTLVPNRMQGKHRLYDLAVLKPELFVRDKDKRYTIAYARVCGSNKNELLLRQEKLLKHYCSQQGWQFELLTCANTTKIFCEKGLNILLNAILSKRVGRLVLVQSYWLSHFGIDLIFSLCRAKHVEIVILNKGEVTNSKEDLFNDIREPITVFGMPLSH